MTELVAVACVVESSLVLASEWSRVLVDYISPLLKRLSEAHTVGSQSTFRMAFVTYGTADTRPTPLLAKRFFVPFQTQVTKELCEQAKNLGIGLTSSGGSRGMAALEGLVAAVELFDTLRTSTETKPLQSQSATLPRDTPHQIPRLVCHILLVAASAADNAERPLWNRSPKLDDVSWETLPAELKKRNINLSVINIRPNTQFTELHSSAATKGVTPPWFKVRPPHSLLLTGFPAEAKPKRSAENQASPETKRARVSQVSQPPSELSPNIPNSSPASVSSAPPAPTLPSQPASANNLPNQSIAPGVSLSPQQFMAKLRQMEAEVRRLTQEYSAAVAQSGLEATVSLKKEKDIKAATLDRFRQAMAAAFTRSQQQHARTNSQGQAQPTNIPAPSNTQAPSLHPQVPATPGGVKSQDTPRGPDQQALIQLMQSRTGTNQSSLPAMPGFPNATPEMVSQMQKLIDNHGIRPPQPPSLPQPTQQNQPAAIAAPALAQQQPSPKSATVWEGSLAWTGFDVTTHDRKELHAQVKLASPAGDIMPKTWPSALTLTPSREPAVSVQDLHLWAKRTKAILCPIQAHPRSVDQQTNERNVRSLVELLTQKRIYALAAWKLPSASQPTNNLLIFPFNGNSLVGTAFPTTGIPEIPKPSKQQLPPAMVAQLQRLTPDQRNLFIAQMMRSRSQPQQPQPPPQFQSQPQPQQVPNYNLGQPNFGDSDRFDPTNLQGNFTANNGMNLLGNTQPGMNLNMSGTMSMMASQQGGMGEMHRRTPSGSPMPQAGGISAVSYEMLQSFMQRNGDGSGGAGMGPN